MSTYRLCFSYFESEWFKTANEQLHTEKISFLFRKLTFQIMVEGVYFVSNAPFENEVSSQIKKKLKCFHWKFYEINGQCFF